MSIWDDLLLRCDDLDARASKIQNGETVGVPSEYIKKLVDDYRQWYSDCLAVPLGNREEGFREQYEGTMSFLGLKIPNKIKVFLDDPTKVSVLKPTEPKGSTLWSHWQYPYETHFRVPLMEQKQILTEISKRLSAITPEMLNERDVEIANLKAQLSTKDAEIIDLRVQRDKGIDDVQIVNQELKATLRRAEIYANIAAVLLGLLLGLLFEVIVNIISWEWLIKHSNSYGLQVGFASAIVFATCAIRPKWRKWCLGVAVLGVFFAILNILGGPTR